MGCREGTQGVVNVEVTDVREADQEAGHKVVFLVILPLVNTTTMAQL
jgi:hypothetical protein